MFFRQQQVTDHFWNTAHAVYHWSLQLDAHRECLWGGWSWPLGVTRGQLFGGRAKNCGVQPPQPPIANSNTVPFVIFVSVMHIDVQLSRSIGPLWVNGAVVCLLAAVQCRSCCPLVQAISLFLHFNSHFSRWNWVSQFYWSYGRWKWYWQLEL